MITMSNIGLETLLGAQMSTYASLYYVSKEIDNELVFFDYHIKKIRFIRKQLMFRQTNFGLKLYEPFEIKNKLIHTRIQNGFIHKYLCKKKYFTKIFPNCVDGFDNDILKLSNNQNYDFQSHFGLYKHWGKYADEIIDSFIFKNLIRDEALKQIKNIKSQNGDNTELISVHFRRGDYLALSSLNLSTNYYSEALDYFKEMNCTFLVFSDDINYCKSLPIFGDANVFFVEGNKDVIDMCLMSQCNHNITANSSFSFWGAMLNKNKNKIVICPKNYVGKADLQNQFMNGNYYPQNWIAINTI